MPFIPEQPTEIQKVPYFEEARKEDGWEGQATEKSVRALQGEIREALSLLGGTITSFQAGHFDEIERSGYRIEYIVEAASGREMPGRIDIAALPVRSDTPRKRDQALRMALYMVHRSLKGVWLLQQLSPGYSALVPFMLGPGDKTISELWLKGPMSKLLPQGDENFTTVEGEAKDVT